MQPNGRVEERSKGTPQGGVISPAANLFMHYAFDKWMERTHPDKPFARYADDGVIHCRTLEEARLLLESLKKNGRMQTRLHPEKTRIVYCKDEKRKEEYPNTSFDFLGYTFESVAAKAEMGESSTASTAVSEQARRRETEDP